jgi:hypothetical protein
VCAGKESVFLVISLIRRDAIFGERLLRRCGVELAAANNLTDQPFQSILRLAISFLFDGLPLLRPQV